MTQRALAVLEKALSLSQEERTDILGGLLQGSASLSPGDRRPLEELPVLNGHRLQGELPSRGELYDEILGT